jgi:putative transposase
MEHMQVTQEDIIERISAIVQEGQAGSTVDDVCQKYRISRTTFYFWKALIGTASSSDMRLKELEDENARLKQLITDAMSDGFATKAQILNHIDIGLGSLFRHNAPQNHQQRSSNDRKHPPRAALR